METAMRRPLIYLVIFLVLLAAPSGIRYLRFYQLSGVDRAEPPQYDPSNVAPVPTPAASEFVDNPEPGKGLVLLDESHQNQFTLDEISYLDGRLAARGYELLHHTGGDLRAALRPVTAFVVITPISNFDLDEIQAVADFVDRGGKLLMIGDPTRFTVAFNEEDIFNLTYTLETDKIPLNSLANQFDIIFNGDYLYNTTENEGNFRNIILQGELGESGVTESLEKLVFYGSHSIQVGPEATTLLTGDENTWSSATDRPGGLVLGATSREGRVLALGDIHFLTEPYYTVFDNGQFIAQIADFLTETDGRNFVLADFPYFYQQPVDLLYIGSPELGADAFDDIIALQEAFKGVDQFLTLSATPQEDHDTLYLGIYNQSEDVAEILASAGITLTIDPEIPTETNTEEESTTDEEETDEETEAVRLIQSKLGNVQMSGTAVILLNETEDRRDVVVLAASTDGLESAINRLLDLTSLSGDYALDDCLLQDGLALCPTNVANETVEAKLETGGSPDIDTDQGDNNGDTGDNGDNGDTTDLNATDQGSISLDETVDGELDAEESHSWTFSEGPVVIDIIMEGNEEMDGVIELYDPDGNLVTSADSTFSGGTEEILGIEVDEGDYTIVIRDYYDDGGGYALTVSESSGVGEGGNGIFVFGDDDGEALVSGFTSVATYEALLSEDYEVTTWIASEDGPLTEDTLTGYALVIWDSGDYRNEEGFDDPDTEILFDYVDSGGYVFISGSSPAIFSTGTLSDIVDLEVVANDPILSIGFSEGEIIELDQTYPAATADFLFTEEDEEGVIPFFLRGPNSVDSGLRAGFAFADEGADDFAVFLLAPFDALPEDVQFTLLNNILAWFGL